jgi:hypothetical protein
VNEALVNNNQIRIHTLSLAARLPAMHGIRDNVEAGGLMSYGSNNPDQFRRAADDVDKIPHGPAVVTERSDRAGERSARSPRCVSSRCGLLFAQQKGQRSLSGLDPKRGPSPCSIPERVPTKN